MSDEIKNEDVNEKLEESVIDGSTFGKSVIQKDIDKVLSEEYAKQEDEINQQLARFGYHI